MKTPLQRIYAAIESVSRSDAPVAERRATYRRKVIEVTDELDRDELVDLVYGLGALLERGFK